MVDSPEQRRYPRVTDRLTLRSSTPERGVAEMTTTNLSLGGAQVLTSRYMPLMTRVEITLHLPPDDGAGARPRPVKAEAVVVRINPPAASRGATSYEMALFFSRMEQQDRTALARYLSVVSAGK